jgi:hypothetical protein
MAQPVKTGVSLLVGAGIGLGLMYLLDPELGAERRKKIQAKAGDTVGGARDAASGFASKVADHTPSIGSLVSPAVSALKEAYEHLGEHLHGHIDAASDVADDARAAGKSAVGSFRDKAIDARDQLLERLSEKVKTASAPTQAKYADLLHDASLKLGHDEEHHYIGQTTCALSSLALGAGLVYFLDPDKGHDRRDNMASMVSTSVSEIGTFFRKIGTRLIHRGQDLADQATEQVGALADKASDLKEQYSGSGNGEATPKTESQAFDTYSPM